MKGKQLSLQEVLNLEDGSKVWVEELNARYSDWSGIHKRVLDELIAEKDEMVYEINYLVWYKLTDYFLYFGYNLETYACALLKLHFLRTMKEIEFLKDEWIIESLNTITNSEETVKFMESLLVDLEKSNTIS